MTVRDLHFKQEIRELTPLDADYPERLRNIPDPPRTLYVRGSLPPDDRPTVAIIGARSASDYGLQVARSFGRALAMQGIGIISGMAAGIDSAGQWGAVDAEAKTYAVFGCGLNVCYPARNFLLYDKILETAVYARVALASPEEIDRLNILRATHLAMRRAAEGVAEKVGAPRAGLRLSILVDGLPVPTLPFPSRNIVKGGAKSLFIAASILAKTARDADCLRLDALYPGYGFAQHKGYPTPAHLEALKRLGPCPEHRRSFGPVSQLTLF